MTPAAVKPLIGVPGRRKTGAQVDGFPGPLGLLEMDVYLADYSRGILNAGGLPVNIPIDADPAEYLPHLHGVVLTGGADLDPAYYGQEPDGNGGYEANRDSLEMSLLTASQEADVPVLGICRGLQIINVHAGGTLHQHVPAHSRYDVATTEHVHEVAFEPGSCVRQLFGAAINVNSLHHQTVDEVGAELVVTGRADDGTVEAMEMPGRNLLAVQWHPEMLGPNDPVFGWLVGCARDLAADPRDVD